MSKAKQKNFKIRAFIKNKGKCEYCGGNMIFSFAHLDAQPTNLATIDHKYNREHEERIIFTKPDERRWFLVCFKCNNDKSKTEPNSGEPNTIQKLIKRTTPKELHDDAQCLQKLQELQIEINLLNAEQSKYDKLIRPLNAKKTEINNKISEVYRAMNKIRNIRGADVQECDATEAS